jgi:hypothetical protein
MKKCFECKNEKDNENFTKDNSKKDGLNSCCKQCCNDKKKYFNEWKKYNPSKKYKYFKKLIEINPDFYKELKEKYEQKIFNKKIKIIEKRKLKYKKHKIYRKSYNKLYNKNRTKQNSQNTKKHRYLHPEREYARRVITQLINSKKLIPPLKCTLCNIRRNKKRKIVAHHPDYSKPLEIIWICQKCHINIHNKKKENRLKKKKDMVM